MDDASRSGDQADSSARLWHYAHNLTLPKEETSRTKHKGQSCSNTVLGRIIDCDIVIATAYAIAYETRNLIRSILTVRLCSLPHPKQPKKH